MSEKYSTEELVKSVQYWKTLLIPAKRDAIIAKLRAADKLYETSKKIADWLKGFEGARLSYLEAQLHDGFKKDIADYEGLA